MPPRQSVLTLPLLVLHHIAAGPAGVLVIGTREL